MQKHVNALETVSQISKAQDFYFYDMEKGLFFFSNIKT